VVEAVGDRHGALALRAQPVVLAGERRVDALPPLASLLPGGGLRLGSTVVVGVADPTPRWCPAGATSLSLALLAGPSAAGSWTAVVGLPALGVVAAAQLGVRLDRLALVLRPGDQWPAVTAALLDSVDAVLVCPPRRVAPGDARRLVARARERGAVLVVAETTAGGWPERADLRLAVTSARVVGLGEGHGHMGGQQVEVRVEGRGQSARPRVATLWLPGSRGQVAVVAGAPVSPADPVASEARRRRAG
jgi:hypothetical protein